MNTTKLTLGKYKGYTYAYVADFDPSYLDWMHANGLCSIDVIHARDRAQFSHKILPSDSRETASRRTFATKRIK